MNLATKCAKIFLRPSLFRNSVIAMKFNKGKTANTKIKVTTDDELTSSNNGSAVTKMIKGVEFTQNFFIVWLHGYMY